MDISSKKGWSVCWTGGLTPGLVDQALDLFFHYSLPAPVSFVCSRQAPNESRFILHHSVDIADIDREAATSVLE